MTLPRTRPVVSEGPSQRSDPSQEQQSPEDSPVLSSDPQYNGALLSSLALTDELEVYQQGIAQTNIIYAEVFEAEIYLQYGITLPAEACVFDVGAHIGLFSLFAHRRQNDIRIFAFEPIQTSYKALCKNLSRRKDQYCTFNYKTFNYGLWSTSTSLPFVYFPYMSGMSGLFADPQKDKEAFKVGIRHWMQENGHEPVLTYDLDTLVESFFARSSEQICDLKTLSEAIHENNVERIDLLKIDVEGSELEVLKGIQEHDWPKIKQIAAEVHNRDLLEQMLRHLVERGFTVTIEEEVGEILERFEEKEGYRLSMIYAQQSKQGTCGEYKTVPKRRYSKSPEQLAQLLQAEQS